MALNFTKFPVRALGPNRVSVDVAMPVVNGGTTASNWALTRAGGAVGDTRCLSTCVRSTAGLHTFVLAQAGANLVDSNVDIRGDATATATPGQWASINSWNPTTKTLVVQTWSAAGIATDPSVGSVLTLTLNFSDTAATPP
jgi:hypothetical protein